MSHQKINFSLLIVASAVAFSWLGSKGPAGAQNAANGSGGSGAKESHAKKYKEALFAGGCFWGVEEHFRTEPGVISTAVGYCGGTTENPTYEAVCTGKTGHAETVRVEYDPKRVPYERLLTIFWRSIDPCSLNRQGPDHGTQYRSVIFYEDDDQKAQALASKAKLQQAQHCKIVTEVTQSPGFWMAEDYHQHYLLKHDMGACH